LSLATVSGCATTGGSADPGDPLEPLNRGLFKISDVADRAIARPIAKGYEAVLPSPVRTGIGNFFENLFYPVVIVNQFLQGKVQDGMSDTGRFLVNTTLGFGGIFDPATLAGLPSHDEDFGQTLAHWGVPAGPYLMVPVLGPRSLRHLAGDIPDAFLAPFNYYDNSSVRTKARIVHLIDDRASLLPVDEQVREAFDPYLFVRDAYTQNREYLIRDGEAPEDDDYWDDLEFEDDF
jgi:phospholipid-binding lipoprotein MlaA